ncbi:sigma-70 family RNA polymerase sigma factor [Clostridioides difficile]
MRTLEERNKLFEGHIKLIWFVINKYYNFFLIDYPHLKEDLFQEAAIGMWKATKCYDEKRGKFSTIARICILGNLNKFLTRYAKKHYRNDIDSIEKSIHRKRSGEEMKIKDSLEADSNIENIYVIEDFINRSDVKDIQTIIRFRKQGYTQEEIANIMKINRVVISNRIKKLRKKMEEE